MAALTEAKISQIQQLYKEIGVYSQVAKIVGCSPATVKKYVTATPIEPTIKAIFDKEIELKRPEEIQLPEFWENWTMVTDEEYEEIKEFWRGN